MLERGEALKPREARGDAEERRLEPAEAFGAALGDRLVVSDRGERLGSGGVTLSRGILEAT